MTAIAVETASAAASQGSSAPSSSQAETPINAETAWPPIRLHRQAYPELERPAQTANIGWLGLQPILANCGTCFVPERVAASYLEGGCLQRIHDSPSLRLPTYVVYPTAGSRDVVDAALETLRALIRAEHDEAA